MDEQQAHQLLQYRMAMSMARELVNRGIISEEEYVIIDTIMTKKHLETSCTIFTNNPGYWGKTEVICSLIPRR